MPIFLTIGVDFFKKKHLKYIIGVGFFKKIGTYIKSSQAGQRVRGVGELPLFIDKEGEW